MLAHWHTTKIMQALTYPIVIVKESCENFWKTWHEVFRCPV